MTTSAATDDRPGNGRVRGCSPPIAKTVAITAAVPRRPHPPMTSQQENGDSRHRNISIIALPRPIIRITPLNAVTVPSVATTLSPAEKKWRGWQSRSATCCEDRGDTTCNIALRNRDKRDREDKTIELTC